MIQHGYTACGACHLDPSGGGVLTDYGRVQGELLLRTRYPWDAADPGARSDFLFGAVTLPEQLLLQADVRGGFLPIPNAPRLLLMQADLRAGVDVGPLVAYASAGAVSEGAQGALFTSNASGANAVVRDAWIGVEPAKGVLVRAGRMNLPFGIRTEAHTLHTRQVTRTTTNDDQQYGVSVSAGGRRWRGELMGIAGNFQVAPDDYRGRGYSLFAAWDPMRTLEIGVSSMVTHAALDLDTGASDQLRQAHGAFVRAAPIDHLSIQAEADVLLASSADASSNGFVAAAELDWEATQGVHLRPIGSWCDADATDGEPGVATGWLGVQWFATSRFDLRVDALHGTYACVPGPMEPRFMGLAQAHFYL
jgi:hypothetical protein